MSMFAAIFGGNSHGCIGSLAAQSSATDASGKRSYADVLAKFHPPLKT
jgi:hypothetical protein